MFVPFSELSIEKVRLADKVTAYEQGSDGIPNVASSRDLWGSFTQSRVTFGPAYVNNVLDVSLRPGSSDFEQLRKLVQEVHGWDDLQKRDGQ